MVTHREKTCTVKLLKLAGSSIAVPLDGETARKCGFLAGSFVRVIVLENEIRLRRAALPRLDDNETYEEYRERMTRQDLVPDKTLKEEDDE